MYFRRYLAILAVLILAVLFIQPVLSEENLTGLLTGKNVTSVTNYTGELQQDPANNYYNYGIQSLNLGDYTAAIKFFNQALAENTTMIKKTDVLLYTYQNKAYSQIQLKDFAGAVATVDAGLVVYPRDPLLWNNRGWALENLGRNQDALAAYNKAVTYNQTYTKAYINLGNLLTDMGRYKDAIAAYTRANQTDPFNIAASDGLDAARKGDAGSTQSLTIILGIVLIVAAGVVVWYVKFRKPAEPAPEEKKKRSRKK